MGFIDFLQSIIDFIQDGIYQLLMEFIGYVAAKAFIWWIETKIWAVTFAWGIFKEIASSLNVSGQIQNAMSNLPGQAYSLAMYFRIPECVNILLAGLGTRFILKFLPV